MGHPLIDKLVENASAQGLSVSDAEALGDAAIMEMAEVKAGSLASSYCSNLRIGLQRCLVQRKADDDMTLLQETIATVLPDVVLARSEDGIVSIERAVDLAATVRVGRVGGTVQSEVKK